MLFLRIICLSFAAAVGAEAAEVPARRAGHFPAQPASGQPVVITAHMTQTVTRVALRVQVVEPGKYVRRTDAAFTNQWTEFPMNDEGRDGDAKKRDGIFSATIPGDLQKHRRLIRYFVEFTATNGAAIRIPAATNECPNFAFFVHDGIPAWTGANRPGKSPALEFPAEFMRTLPAYHLIANVRDVEQSQWDGNANKKRFHGTLVYDGRVHDHIQFHNRGRGSIYNTGKNKWGFRFNREEPFRDRDLWGREKASTWSGISLTACAAPWAQVNRGMAGMDEAVAFRAYQLAGVPSPATHWIQFRVVSGPDEARANNQYGGDLWGLYQVIEEPGGSWLRNRELPDGDIYYPESGLKHRAKGTPTNDVAYQKLMQGSQRGMNEAWWRTNLDLGKYYSFNALNRLLSNIDVRPGANHYLYRQPDGRWVVVPWDLDMMFIPRTHQPGFVDQIRCLDVPALRREYQARAREIIDLFCSDTNVNGGQYAQLVAELAGFLTPTNHARNWAELDQFVWNHHPRSNTRGQFYMNPARDGRFGGEWTRTLATPDFAGFCKYLTEFGTDSRPVKNYAINDGDQRGYGFGYLSVEARDEKIPARPVIQLTGSERKEIGFKLKLFGKGPEINLRDSHLTLQISPFAPGPKSTNGFAAVQWRLGEISAPGVAGWKQGAPCKYEIEELWRSAELMPATNNFRLSLEACQPGHTYRARARHKDTSDRWSHWSEPVQFVAK
jgi:hypothetical protein